MQHLRSVVAVYETTMQHLRGAVAVCETTMQHLRSVAAVCETTMQHLRSLVAVCETTMQHPHSLVAVCETTTQYLHSLFVMCAPTTGTIIHPCGMSGGRMLLRPYMYPAKLRCPRRGRPYHGDNHSSLRDVWGAYAFAPLHVSGQTSLPPQGPPLHGYNHLAPGTRQTSPASADASSQLLGIVNA